FIFRRSSGVEQGAGHVGDTMALVASYREVSLAWSHRVPSRNVRRAVRSTARKHGWIRVAERDDDQTEMGHRSIQRQQRRFVSSMLGGSRPEHRSSLSIKLALHPEAP